MGNIPQTPLPEPASMQAAESLYDELNDACSLIQAQLSNKNHEDERGNRLGDVEYHQWRQKATYALAMKNIQKRQLKRWIAARRQEASRIEAGIQKPNNVVELMAALLQVIKDGVDWNNMTPREKAIIQVAQQWIRDKGAPAVVAAREKAQAAS